jgi:protein-S-isoprenylcysteine O-methyltransferase
MIDLTLLFIIVCFLIQISFWLSKLSSTKKIIKKTGGKGMRFVFYFLIATFIFLQYNVDFLKIELWSNTLTTKIIADVITFIGLLIMLWARKALDKNWSADIVLKENHELIISGPYAFVRHPIYTGLSMMVLGVVIYVDTLAFTIFFILFFLGAYYKAKKEEKLLISHFGEQYIIYKKNVKTLIPFIF